MTQNPYYTSLPARGLIHVEGPDRHDFLQNLVTNDITKLTPGKALYACLLSPQGKFLHDFFISEGADFILLECEGGARAQDLFKRLNQYRLRADVKISVEEAVPVYALMGAQQIPGYPDPRDPEMGHRSFEKPDGIKEEPFETWDTHRIKLCIPDGSRDMMPGASTLDEAHIEKLNGVSYDKGCYVGQELTARMHYRGLGKKHLYTVNIPELLSLKTSAEDPRFRGEDNIEFGDPVIINGKQIGEMRSRCSDIGIALLKDESLAAIKDFKVLP